MSLLSDILLIVGTIGLTIYCTILSRRLRALGRSDTGLGETISNLSMQVDKLTATAEQAIRDTENAADRLVALNEEAERREGELAFLLAGSEQISADPDEQTHLAEPHEPVFARRFQGDAR